MFFEKHKIPKECRKYIIMSQTEWEKQGFYVFLNEVREECLVLDILTRDEETLREIHKAMDSILMNEISKEPAFHIFEEVVMTHHMSQDDAAYWSRVPESGIDQWKIDNGIDCAHLILPSSSNPPAPWILKGKLSEIKKMKQCLDSLSERNENTCREDRISQTTTIINVPYHFGEELKTIHGNALEQIESSTGTSIVLLGPKNDNYDEFGVEFKGGFEKVELAIEKVETLGPEAERVDYLQIPEYYIGDVKEKLRSWKRDFRDVSFSIDELVVEGSFTLILRGPAGKTNIAAMKVREIGTTNNMNRRNEIFHSPKNHSRLNPDYFQKRQEEIEERMKRYAEEKEMKEREEKRIWKEKRRAVNIRN